MNPLATPDNIKAAQQAVAEQTAATVAQVEAQRAAAAKGGSKALELEKAFRALERPVPILSGVFKVRAVDGMEGEPTDRKVVTLAEDNGITLLETTTCDAALQVIGAEFAFELIPLGESKGDPNAVAVPPPATVEVVQTIEPPGVLEAALGNPPFQGPAETNELPPPNPPVEKSAETKDAE